MAIIKNTRDGIALIPSAFKVEEITITNKVGETIDIQAIIQEITLSESIYSPTMMCKISLKDESNIIESLPIYGLETVFVKLSRKKGEDGAEQIIERLFYITEYPLFGRPRQEHMQVWTIHGVSHHAWKNPLKKISRFYEGPIVDEIIKIGKDGLGIDVIVEGAPFPDGKGIINIQSPLQAIDWFRRRLHEATGVPFYFYEMLQNLPGEVFLKSHDVIANQGPYTRFYDTKHYKIEEVGTQEDYDIRKHRMIDVTSDLKLSKLVQVPTGAFSSENNFVDIATRKFFKKYYTYPGDFPLGSTIYGTDILLPPPDFDFSPESGEQRESSPVPAANENEENIGDEFFSYMEHMSLNTEAFEGAFQNYNVWSHEKVHVMNAFPGIFNTLAHEVKVFGDFELNAGKKVELFFPKAADPMSTGKGDVWDNYLSGEYIIISTQHTFKNQEYYTEFRAKRDSFPL